VLTFLEIPWSLQIEYCVRPDDAMRPVAKLVSIPVLVSYLAKDIPDNL
jgi:hypothetical protein